MAKFEETGRELGNKLQELRKTPTVRTGEDSWDSAIKGGGTAGRDPNDGPSPTAGNDTYGEGTFKDGD
jgi:hypothetical protein